MSPIKSFILFFSILSFSFFNTQARSNLYYNHQKINIPIQVQDTLPKIVEPNDLIVFEADSGNYQLVEFMLKTGIDPNSSLEGGYTALMYAAQNGDYKMAKLLIDYGANINLVPENGNTALFAAVRSNHDSIAELLLNNGANVKLLNSELLSPLHYAAGSGYTYLVDLLVYYGAPIDITDLYGNTPLMFSVYAGTIYSTEILIKSGANVNAADNYGNTPLMVAAQFNDTAMIKILYKAGAKPDITNKKGVNALSFAIKNDAFNASELLLDLGIAKDTIQTSKSYYQQAIEQGNEKIRDLLRSRNLKTKVRPNIANINFYSGMNFNSSDFMFDFGGGVYEPVSRTLIDIGYKYRPKSCRITEYRQNNQYQFWEKRYSIYLSLQHLQELKKKSSGQKVGFSIGLNNELTWSFLHGSNHDRVNFIFVPSFGLFTQSEFYTVIAKWEIANYKSEGVSFNRFGIQLFITIPSTKNRVINKNINLLN